MLTDTAVRTAKPTDKPRKLADEKGLFLLVTPSGGKWWRLKYRFGGKEKLLALGVYPAVTLKDARERREEARKLLANGADPGELRHAEWTEFDFDKAEWRIPAGKMKMKEQHIVPLSAQSVAILREIEALTGQGRYVFPSERGGGRPMSENTINGALRRLGYTTEEMTGHGFRSMASTMLHELQYPHAVIERQLAHGERNKASASYNFAEHLPERRKMMLEWANYLDELKVGAEVIQLRRAAA